jgi:basic amino acid/polyamine antiporter, APA family
MNPRLPRSPAPELIRAIGRWSMVALAVNCILGSGIFGLPAPLAGLLGPASPLAVLLAGLAMAVIIACYAEVASQFTETGGHYIYVRRAFGAWAGLEVGWLTLLTRLAGCAASVNLLVISLGEFWPGSAAPLPRLAIISAVVGTLAFANYRGVASGTLVSNVSVVAKLIPLGLICIVGLVFIARHAHAAQPPPSAGVGGWLEAMLLMFFAYGGYEAALIPAGEARDPKRDMVFALFVALALVAFVYTSLQLIVVSALPDATASERPLADVARVMMGQGGAALISLGALISVYGYLSAHLLAASRATYALAVRGEFPAWFAAVHPRFRTPFLSIVAFAFLVWAFALLGSFTWNVTLSACARLFYFAAVCAAVPVLRRRQPGAASFRVPGGPTLPLLGVALCLTLLTRVDFSRGLILLAVMLAATLNWLLLRGRGTMAGGEEHEPS